MGKFRLALGIHNHQPVGNFDAVFEEAHQKAYLPLLQLLLEHPTIKLSLHQSGILWHWQQQVHPDYFSLVKKLVQRNQIELLTGGFYEPILTAIPTRDVQGQIKKLTLYLAEHFAVRPTGLWLTERIWEPHLPRLLAEAGVKFLPVDDTHFIYAGFEQDQLTGPFITEQEGLMVTLLPIQKRLRYLIPFGRVEDVMNELKKQAERNLEGLAVYADDGEKFGVWPNTYEHCYKQKWLEKFFTAVEKESDWLDVVTLSEAAETEPHGRAYLPSASYAEMLHWSLPPKAFVAYEQFEHWVKSHEKWEQYGRFVRGGHWRGFLAKYDEANLMHKKMQAVSKKLAECELGQSVASEELALARNHLYAGQCNCPYWHGVFGGLYLPHIRQAVYANLIAADAICDKLLGHTKGRMAIVDFDCDGNKEIQYESPIFSVVIRPRFGGTLLHLALNKHNCDVTDTLTRRREGYHLKLDQRVENKAATASIHDIVQTKEKGLDRFLMEDWYLKRCFIDHFLSHDATFEHFQSGEYGEEGDFILEPYDFTLDKQQRNIILKRVGHIHRSSGTLPMQVIKTFRFEEGAEFMQVTYELIALTDKPIVAQFAFENNFTFQAGHAEDRFITIDGQRHKDAYLDSVGSHKQVSSYTLVDQYRGLAVGLLGRQPCNIWHMPIFTVSLSEGGFERVYQGTTLLNVHQLSLSNNPTTLEFTLHAGSIETVQHDMSRLVATAGSLSEA